MTRLLICAAVCFVASQANAEVVAKTGKFGGFTVNYKVVLPNGYDPAKAYPAVMAFSGGSQAENTLQMDLRRNWREPAEKRGYLVFIAAAPDGNLYFEGGEHIFPDFLKQMQHDYKILGNKFHVAGPSNGGISSFHVAALYPQYFWSVTGFPGYLIDATPARLKAISGLCIYMFAGELDRDWSGELENQSRMFRAQGMSVQTSIEKGQPHLIGTLAGDGAARLFDQFDQARNGCKK